jgi:multicomponent Na+:H+ antiporter subunit F
VTVVAVTVTAMLAVAGGLTLVRIIRGPSILDRAVATDVLLAIVVAAIATETAYSRDATALPVLVVLAVLGFVGSVSVARFAAQRNTK